MSGGSCAATHGPDNSRYWTHESWCSVCPNSHHSLNRLRGGALTSSQKPHLTPLGHSDLLSVLFLPPSPQAIQVHSHFSAFTLAAPDLCNRLTRFSKQSSGHPMQHLDLLTLRRVVLKIKLNWMSHILFVNPTLEDSSSCSLSGCLLLLFQCQCQLLTVSFAVPK